MALAIALAVVKDVSSLAVTCDCACGRNFCRIRGLREDGHGCVSECGPWPRPRAKAVGEGGLLFRRGSEDQGTAPLVVDITRHKIN